MAHRARRGALHFGALVTRGLAAGRVPWGNMYEFVLTLTLVGAVAWLVVLVRRRRALRPLGLFVTLALVLLLGFAGMVLYTPAGPLVPALNSYWLKIHVTAAAIASGIFLLGVRAGGAVPGPGRVRRGASGRFPYTAGAAAARRRTRWSG